MNADTGRAWSSERGSPCGLVEGRGRRSRHREMKCPARRWGEAQVADQPWLRRTKERGSSCVLALRAEHRVSHLCDARDATGSERPERAILICQVSGERGGSLVVVTSVQGGVRQRERDGEAGSPSGQLERRRSRREPRPRGAPWSSGPPPTVTWWSLEPIRMC